MFDISWSHLLIFALAAIILVPSKDLPALLRTIGRYVGDARKMAREFRSQVDDALRETELADVKKSVEAEMRSIETSASMKDAEHSLNAALNGSDNRPPPVPQPTGQIIPSVATALPVREEVSGPLSSDPLPHTVTVEPGKEMAAAAPVVPAKIAGIGSRPRNDGIEVVRAGRGSVAQRAAAAWKKTAGSEGGG